MLWWKSKGKDILRLVRVNDRIQIELGRSSFLSRVEDIRSDALVIAAPVEEGDVLSLYPGTEIILKVFLAEGVRRFSAKVRRMRAGRVPLVEMEKFSDLGVLQRRKYPRAPATLQVRFRAEKAKGRQSDWCEGTTADISFGGLQIAERYTASDLHVGDFVEIALSMPDNTEIPAICNVVRAQKSNHSSSSNRFAVEFAEIEPEAQDRIGHLVERKKLESEGDRRRYVQCTVPISVSYRQSGAPSRRTSSNDICTGGLRMPVSGQSFMVGEVLDLTIELPQKKVQIESVVVWVGQDKGAPPDAWEVGVRFAHMDQRTRDAITKFLLMVHRGETESKAA